MEVSNKCSVTINAMSMQVQPPVPPQSLIKTEALTVTKNEAPEVVEIGINDILNSSDDEIIPNIKNIDIVPHIIHEDSIKSEIVPKNIVSKHSDFVETQVFVKTENSPFIKTENIIQNENLNKTEEPTNGNVKTITTSLEKDKKKIRIIRTPVIPVEPHEYTSLAENKHVCNHCQYVSNSLDYVKLHITEKHRKVTIMYMCPYCPFKSKGKWESNIRKHIILKHKETKDIRWFKCHLCERKFKLKWNMTNHMNVHLTHDQMRDRLKLCPVCGKAFKATSSVTNHLRFVHNKEERKKVERKCQECEYTTTESKLLKHHIKNTHKKPEKRYCCEKCGIVNGYYSRFKQHELSHKTKAELDNQDLNYCCDNCNYKTYSYQHLKRHKIIHLKPDEIHYFYCYHCSYKSKRKEDLKAHISRHFKNQEVQFHCYICNFMTLKRQLISEHVKKHSKVQIKREIKEES